MDAPLSDITVLDLTRALAGPIASRLLADLGARVIKIEPPAGDLTRSIVPRVDGMSAYFAQYNAGKECVSIDLNVEAGRDLFLQMVEHADIVLENYRPDVMERLGLTFDTLRQHNPRIVLASVSGWGHGNSRSNQGAFASTIHAEAGVTEMVARRRGDTVYRNDPMSHADTYTGLHAFGAVLAALHLRDRTGEGQCVEVSMAERTLTVNDLASVELTGEDPPSGFRAGQNWSAIYEMANGRHVNITMDVTNRAAFGLMIEAMDRRDLAEDPRFAEIEQRIENRAELEAIVGEWVKGFDSAAAVEAAIGDSSVLAAEVRTVPELADTSWARERGAFVEVDTGRGAMVTVPQSPWRFRDAPTGVGASAHYRGADNRRILGELLGLGESQIDELEASGVISERPPRWARDD
jgi:CoA:oxalate CoA-transferase